jgi:ATP-dependent RNA helicase DDX18/HAS1
VAARGLDIPEVDWIVQYDPPDDPKVTGVFGVDLRSALAQRSIFFHICEAHLYRTATLSAVGYYWC